MQEEKEKVVNSLIRILKDKTNDDKRLQILYSFHQYKLLLDSPKLMETLISLLKNDPNSDIRRTVAKRFSYIKSIKIMEALITAMEKDEDPYVRFDSTRALGTLDLVEAIPALVKTMQNDPYGRIRDEAAFSLGSIGDESAIPFLANIVRNDDEIFNTAAIAIANINGEKAVSSLIKLLSINKTKNLWYVIYALELLYEKAQKAIPPLCEIAENHRDFSIRAKAIYALGYIGGNEAIQSLQNLLEREKEEYIRFWSALSLARILGEDSKSAEMLWEFFAIGYLEDDQITEYRLLARKWYFEERKKSKKMTDTEQQLYQDEILKRIKDGENRTTEFKAYLRWNEYTKKPNNKLKFKVVKTIAAMMNSEGGILFIGVKNNGEIVGIEKDYATFNKGKQNRDGFQLFLNNAIKQYIGLKYNIFYSIAFANIKKKDICIITIKSSDGPIYIKKKHDKDLFVIRADGGNSKLNIKDAHEYIKMRWGK
ncbi:MAG: hypothetical protein GF308_14660 [Candidatus Heimdallarchaeota archaeon]|nr:hypothetical protein [Candidatus Heimdallarchaeota archaeon]